MKKMTTILDVLLNNFMHDILKIDINIQFKELSFEEKSQIYGRFINRHTEIGINLAINKSNFYWQRIPLEVLEYNIKNKQFLSILEYMNNPNANIIKISPDVWKKAEMYSRLFLQTILDCRKPLLLDTTSIHNKFNFLYDAYNQGRLTNLNIKWKTLTQYYLVEFSIEPLQLKGTDNGNIFTRCKNILWHIHESVEIKKTYPQVNSTLISLVDKSNISAKDSLSYINILDKARDNEQIAINNYNQQIARLNEQTAINNYNEQIARNNEQTVIYKSKRAN